MVLTVQHSRINVGKLPLFYSSIALMNVTAYMVFKSRKFFNPSRKALATTMITISSGIEYPICGSMRYQNLGAVWDFRIEITQFYF